MSRAQLQPPRPEPAPAGVAITEFAADVARDLQGTPKRLQSRYLYDALGSSLFEAICRLPWYHVARAEKRLLDRHAAGIVSRALAGARATIVELGVGSGEKLAIIASALPPDVPADVHLIDISPAALDRTIDRLSAYPQVRTTPHEGTYQAGLSAMQSTAAAPGKLVLFLGSNIGNFDGQEARVLLRDIRQRLADGDSLLLGADLVKPERDLLLAYDDPLGVTAAFNKNLLVRINRELGAAFPLAAFEHEARWNGREQRVEMHLVSRHEQWIAVPALDVRVHFAAGESIWTESSYKYTEEAIVALGADAGFSLAHQWIDPEGRFALSLFQAK